MTRSGIACLIALTTLAGLTTASLSAQHEPDGSPRKELRYRLVDLGTFGGPNSGTNGSSVVINKSGVVVGGADTAIPCPYNPQFLMGFAFKWEHGTKIALPRLGHGCSGFPIAINSQGDVVGSADTGALDPATGVPIIHAVLWTRGQIIDLGTLGGTNSLALDINDDGQIAGLAQNAIPDFLPFGDGISASPTEWRAFLWHKGTMIDVGTLGGPDSGPSGALALNDRGQLVGSSYVNSVINPALGQPDLSIFLWERNGLRDLGTLGGSVADPRTINASGQIVGVSSLAGDQLFHAFLWQTGTMEDLGTLGGSFSVAGWINNGGQVIGASTTTGDSALRGFLWDRGEMTSIEPVPGDACSDAFQINGRGQVIGPSSDCNGNSRGYLWQNGITVDLNSFVPSGVNIHLGDPGFINDEGEIVAAGYLPDGSQHAVVLVPCTESEDEPCVTVELDSAHTVQSVTTASAAVMRPHGRLSFHTALSGRRDRLPGIFAVLQPTRP